MQNARLDEAQADIKITGRNNDNLRYAGDTTLMAESKEELKSLLVEVKEEKNWRQDEKGTTEDEMAGWHNQLNGHEFEQTLGDCEGQGSLACCSSWDCKESDTTWVMEQQWLNNSATAAAKLLQSCLTLCDPIDGSPPDSPIPGILQARVLEWGAISFSNVWKWSHLIVSNS